MDKSNIENLATSLRRELESLHLSSDDYCCIYRVPQRLRQLDSGAYTPRMVSIGPLHHGREELKPMEEYKRRYLKDFLQRSKVSLEDFIKFIKEKEVKIRNCYAETIRQSSDDFVKMILVDAAFTIELILRYSLTRCRIYCKDDIYEKPWAIIDLTHDMWLLENQLPFFVLEDLLKLANIPVSFDLKDGRLSMIKLIHEFSKYFWGLLVMGDDVNEIRYSKVRHLLHFLRISILPSDAWATRKRKMLTTPTVTELHQAGVEIKVGSSRNLFRIKFDSGFEIPKIEVHSTLEPLLRNLLAFEQCHCVGNFINDYVLFMTYLINTPKDVELLVQHGIIENRLRNSEGVSTLFHNLVDGSVLYGDCFYYSELVEDLNRYCKTPWNKWKATLKQDYFNTPWATVSVVGAVILLLLTFIQAMCSVLALI